MTKPNPGKRLRRRFQEIGTRKMVPKRESNPGSDQRHGLSLMEIVPALLFGIAQRKNAVIASLYGTTLLAIGALSAIATAWILRWVPTDLLPSSLMKGLWATPLIIMAVISVVGLAGGTVVLAYYWKNRDKEN